MEQQQKEDTQHGLVEFKEKVKLTTLQETMARGYKSSITIDWGDYQRQGWSKLSPQITKINSTQLVLRNNRYSPILKQLSHIHFDNLIELSMNSNSIYSLQFLPKFQTPHIKEINFTDNFIISTRSLRKISMPTLKILRFEGNPLVDNTLMFQGYFPSLTEFSMDGNFKQGKSWSDPAIWRVKNAPILVNESEPNRAVFRRNRAMMYMLKNTLEAKKLQLSRYREMLKHKPRYFEIHPQ